LIIAAVAICLLTETAWADKASSSGKEAASVNGKPISKSPYECDLSILRKELKSMTRPSTSKLRRLKKKKRGKLKSKVTSKISKNRQRLNALARHCDKILGVQRILLLNSPLVSYLCFIFPTIPQIGLFTAASNNSKRISHLFLIKFAIRTRRT
jgi:hypothetical protein